MITRSTTALTIECEDRRLADLVDSITETLQAGQPIDLAAYAAEYPEYAEQLQNWIAALKAIVDLGESFSPAGSRATGVATGSISHEPVSGILGDFRIVRELGRGGMGVVYEAEQISLKRRVALKVLPFAAVLDPKQVARFKNEAQAAANLDHPHIVSVYSVGCDRGIHYYAMQYVEGQSLAEVVEELRAESKEQRAECEVSGVGCQVSATAAKDTAPIAHLSTLHAPGSQLHAPSPCEHFRQIARLGIQAAEALQYAHEMGIVHRDIKPSNLLVDAQSHLWITDFGLATTQTDAGLTMTGDLLGTLRYMSPEQAAGDRARIDYRTDIYSLGITLYELLAGQPAFAGTDRQVLLRRIALDEPSSLRQVNPRIPLDLETITLKAMRKDPAQRYDTAQDLADDLRSFLEDKPIKAMPPTWREQLVKWTRRHPAAVWAAALLLSCTALISLVSALLITGAYKRATTEAARAQAVSNLLQEMLGSADAARAKGVDYKVRELLDDFSAALGSQLADQPEVEADIHATIGRAYRSLKLPDKAQPHFEKAIELQRQVDGPQSEKLAAILVDGAWNLLDQRRHAEAETQANDALKIYRARGITGAPLFHALEILQHILISAKRDDDAERVTKEALEIARQSGQEFAEQANLLHRYADMKIRQGHFAEGEKLASQAVDMHRRLHGDRHYETAWGLKTLAKALVRQQKPAEAEAAVREALKIFRHQFPDDHDNVRDTIYQLRAILEARGDKPALEALAKEEAIYSMRSGTPEYHIRLGELLTRQSISVRHTHDAERLSTDAAARSEEAHRQFQEAIEAYDRMAMERPDDLERRYRALDGYLLTLSHCAPVPGFEGEVDELSRRLEAELPKYLADFPDSIECQWNAAMCYLSWQRVLPFQSEHLPAIERACHQAADILSKLSLSVPDRPNLWIWLASANTLRASVYWQLCKFDDAAAPLRTAMEIYDQHAEKIDADIAADPYPHIHLEIVNAQLFYAMFLVATNREHEAAEFVRKADLRTTKLTEPVDLVAALWIKALLQLRLGDETGYRETCKALLDVPVTSADELTKMRTITTWCFGPETLADMTLVVERAEQLAANNSVFDRHAVLYELGMALYRAGQYEQAEEQLKASIEAYPEKPAPGWDTIDFQRLFLAMTKSQRGQQDEARRLLTEALPAVDEAIQKPATWPHYRIALELLRREAMHLIEPKLADEAVETESRTSEEPRQ